jgi:hypothetical protein
MSSLLKAYLEWASIDPEFCDCLSHVMVVTEMSEKMRRGLSVTTTTEKIVEKPDIKVCKRERKWRAYVEIRDGRG